MKKIILTMLIITIFSTSAFAFFTPYTLRNSNTYKFVYKVALELYTSPNNYNIKKKIYTDSPLLCALKAIKLCTIPFCGASTGITDVEIQEMATMLEEDLKKETNK